MNIGSVLTDIGIAPVGGAEPVIAHFKRGAAAPKNYLFSQAAGTEIDNISELFVSTGLYIPESISEFKGKDTANVVAVRMIPFDSDLVSYTGFDKETIYNLPDEEIGILVSELHSVLTRALEDHGLSLHVAMSSGHGIHSFVLIRDARPQDTRPLQAAAKAFIQKINEDAGYELIDPQKSDPGPGLIRIPGSWNKKEIGPKRLVSVITQNRILPAMSVRQFTDLAGTAERMAPPRPRVVISSNELGDDLADEIVNAIAPYWQEGSRHTIALGLCGLLAKAGVPMEQTADIISTISAGDSEAWDRLRAVRTTYDRIAAGQDVSGYFTLQRSIGAETLQYLTGKLDVFQQGAQPRPVLIAGGKRTDETGAAPTALLFTTAPERAFYGWVGKYRDLMAPTSEASDNFHLGAALAMVGAHIGRRVHTRNASDDIYANCFHVLIGLAGSSRKDSSIKRAIRMHQHYISAKSIIVTPYVEVKDIVSGEAMVDAFREVGANLLWYITEMTTLFRHMRRESTKNLGDKAIEAFDVPDTLETRSSTKGPRIAEKPFLSILAAIQPGRLEESMQDIDVVSGFANRWGYFPGIAKPRMARPPEIDVAAAAELYGELRDCIAYYEDGERIDLDDEAKAIFDEWYENDAIEPDEYRQNMKERHQTLIHKYALIFAVTDRSPVIRAVHLEAAMALVRWMWSEVIRMLPNWGASTDSRIENKIIEVLLRERRPLSRRELQRLTNSRKWGAREFSYVFEAMLKNGTIEPFTDGKAVVYQIAA